LACRRSGNDFLAVIDADPESMTYRHLLTTLATDQQPVRMVARVERIHRVYLESDQPFHHPFTFNAENGLAGVDRFTNQIVGAGMINFALRRAAEVRWQVLDINKDARARQKLQKPLCLWLTGLPGAGKSTIANLLEKQLFASGRHTYVLDGDNIRHGLSRDLGFTEADRVENIRRAMEVATLFVDAGLVVIVAFISPYRAERDLARSRFEPDEFVEIYVDACLEECERRDPKGLYAKARRGELANVTGIDSDYEPPTAPEIHLDTVARGPDECVNLIFSYLESNALNITAGSEGSNGRPLRL
jgi:bifunctional enzyme CysN/CysC